jgi:hypothetical protein
LSPHRQHHPSRHLYNPNHELNVSKKQLLNYLAGLLPNENTAKMDVALSNMTQATSSSSAQADISKLEFEFSWSKFSSFIYTPSDHTKPLYSVGFKTLKSRITFKNANGEFFGSGYLPGISIDTNCTIHGKELKLQAQKRWSFRYEYISNVFTKGENGEGKPQTMTWVCETGLKFWDYVLLDSKQMPVARFRANMWGIKRIGWLELLGEVKEREELRDEVVVTGITLFYLTVVRVNSLPSVFGAIFASPRKTVKGKDKIGDDDKED